DVTPVPKNMYGATKKAAEELAELVHLDHGLPCVILRTSRFFPEPDDRPEVAERYEDLNIKTNELLYRRVDLADAVSAHLAALERAPALGFGRYIVSASTPFTPEDLVALRSDAASVVRRLFPDYEEIFDRLGWTMLPGIERVYVNAAARADLDWSPLYDFRRALESLRNGLDPRSALALAVGAKGYHSESVHPYTVR
ncbi:MAG TPA: NAD(P)-dependent oxidoreductase, partial [Acidimicrobiales bacterium]|nr:NAD(P)-dependent oxidoreductase [Acidimicrobiales bacterium]